MALSVADYIEACYSQGWYRSTFPGFDAPSRDGYSKKSIEDTRAFTKYLKINLDAPVLEIPCAYQFVMSDILVYNSRHINEPNNTLYIPLYYLDEATGANTLSTLLRTLFYNSYPTSNLTKVAHNNSNIKYLGGRGIILYEDYTPLMLLSFQVEKRLSENSTQYLYYPIKPLLRINPIIYDKDDILAKYIRGKFIPTVLSLQTGLYDDLYVADPANVYNGFNSVHENFKIIIEDFSYMFESPSIPDATFDSNKINAMLYKDFKDSVIKL